MPRMQKISRCARNDIFFEFLDRFVQDLPGSWLRKLPIFLTMKQQPRCGARRVDRYAGTFFICWGDETLNMIVSPLSGKSSTKRSRNLEQGCLGSSEASPQQIACDHWGLAPLDPSHTRFRQPFGSGFAGLGYRKKAGDSVYTPRHISCRSWRESPQIKDTSERAAFGHVLTRPSRSQRFSFTTLPSFPRKRESSN